MAAKKKKKTERTDGKVALNLVIPPVLNVQIEEFAEALGEQTVAKSLGVRVGNMTKSEAVRHLIVFGLKHWKAEVGDGERPDTVF